MPNLSLYDLAVLNRNDAYTGLVEDVTTLAPEFSVMAAVPRKGTWYEIARRVTLPSIGFRQPNVGVSTSKSTYKKEVKQMFFGDGIIQLDEAIQDADSAELGAAWQLEAAGVMRSFSILIGQQTYYGTSADAGGFQGVRAQLSGTKAAGGTSNSTSAYLLWQDSKEGVRYDVGQNGQFALSAPTRQLVADPNNSGKSYFAFVGNLKCWIGFNVQSALSCWAVTGIDSSHSLTDALASDLIAQIPAARRSNLRWFMNRTSESLLQKSRTAITYQVADAAGRGAFSPLPTQLGGYPITVTDSVLNTETNS